MNFKPNMLFLNRSFDKKRLKALLLWFRLNLSENAALKAVEILQGLGFHSATQGAISLGLDDLKTPKSKGGRVFQAQVEVALAHHEHHRGNRTPVELFQHLVDTWHRTSQDLTTEVVQLFHSTERVNPVYMMAFSGARGNISQVRQLVGMRGLMADPRGQIVGFPILSNFREGLTITEYFVSCYGARKGVVDTAIRTADAGYLTRRLADVSHHVVVRTTNCGTHESILLRDIKEGQKTILSLANRLVGRVLAEHVSLPIDKTSPASNSEMLKLTNQKRVPNSIPLRYPSKITTEASSAKVNSHSNERADAALIVDEESEVRNKRTVRGITLAPAKGTSYPLDPLPSSVTSEQSFQYPERVIGTQSKRVKDMVLSPAALDKSGERTGTIIYRNSEITSSLASKLAAHYLEVPVRSPLSCSLPWGVCQLCYGWGLSEGRRVTLGEAVGIIAAQSIGEPGTQLTLRTFHTGGVFSGELLNEIRAPYNGNVMFPTPLQGLLIRTPHGQIAFLTKVSGKMKVYETEMHFESKRENSQLRRVRSSATFHDLPQYLANVAERRSKLQQDSEFLIQPSTVIFVKQKEYVVNNQLLAEFSSSTLQSVNDQIEITQQVLSDIAGQIWFKELEYGNRKGPGSGSLGIYFSSQKLGGIWVLAGKPMRNAHSSFASPTRTANLLPQSNSSVRSSATLVPHVSARVMAYPSVAGGKELHSQTSSLIKSSSCLRKSYSSNTTLVPSEFHANDDQTEVWLRFARGRGTPSFRSSMQIEDLQKRTSKEFNEYKVKPLLSFAFAKELENENWSEAASTINNFAKSKSDSLKSFIPLVTIVKGKQKLQIENNISSKIIREISRYNNLVAERLSKSPKTNLSFLKRKNLFKYRIYGIQNRLKLFINTRIPSAARSKKAHYSSGVYEAKEYANSFQRRGVACGAKTCKTSRIHNYGYSLQRSDVLKYDYVLGYSQRASFKKLPFHHNSQSLLFKYRKNNKFIIYGKKQRDLKSRATDKSFERIDNKIKKNIFIFQELRVPCKGVRSWEPQKSPSNKFTSVAELRIPQYPKGSVRVEGKGQGKIRGLNNKLDMLPLLAESDLVTFVTNYNPSHNHTPCKSNVGQVFFHPAEIKTNSLPSIPVLPPLDPYFNKTSFSLSTFLSTQQSKGENSINNKSIRFLNNSPNNRRFNKSYLSTIVMVRSSATLPLQRAKSLQYPLPLTQCEAKGYANLRFARGIGVRSSDATLYPERACSLPLQGIKMNSHAEGKGYRTPKKFFVSQGNKSSYFATEKRRLQSTWIQKKRAYLTFLNQVCPIPFTQQFSKNTNFNSKGYTAGAFTNFIGRTNVQLSTFNSIRTGLSSNAKLEESKATLVPSSEYITSYKYKSYKSKSGRCATVCNSVAELRTELSCTMYKPATPFWRKGNNNLFTKNNELGRNQRSVRGVMLTNSVSRVRSGHGTPKKLAQLNFVQRNPIPCKGKEVMSTSCVNELCQRIVLRNCANEVGHVFPGQLVTYGDNITNNIVTTESGQILYIDSQKTTVRKAQTVLIYSQAIIAVLSGDWIKKGTPLMSLSYQKLVTGDIVQGLPKIEQFFEAPVLRDGTFWSDSLQAKLNQYFQEEREKLPLAEAVRKGFSEIQRVLVEGVLRVYISQGVLIADKHLEVIVRQMTCKGRILYSGDTGFLRNELVSLDKIENVNQVTYGQKALYHPQVRGITDASLESESFLSAASFQETTRVLSRDAIIGKTDLMRGLKERVIVGELIQAGTGLANNSVYNLLADCIA